MSSVAVGTAEPGPGPGPDRKRRRLLDAGGPVEDDETARRKMRDAEVYKRGVRGTRGEYDGFDPENVGDVKYVKNYRRPYDSPIYTIKPMGYFARFGDLPMMRWLYVNGADTRDEDVDYWFPMVLAAAAGHNEACRWLFVHGAAKDIKRTMPEVASCRHIYGRSALFWTFGRPEPSKRTISRWLILNGALCKDDDSGELNVEIMKQDLDSEYNSARFRERKALLKWANDLHRARTSFLLFLSGAQQHAPSTRRTVSSLQLLGGKPEILELIGDHVGFVRGREARIIRQLTEMLPDLIQQFDEERRAEKAQRRAEKARRRAFRRDLRRGARRLLRLAEEAKRSAEEAE